MPERRVRMKCSGCSGLTAGITAAAAGFAAVFFAPVFTGCALDSRPAAVWGGDCTVPEFTGVRMTGENTAVMDFSSPVEVVSAEAVLDSGESCAVEIQDGAETGEVCFVLGDPPGIGEKFILSAVVEDERGNSLSVAAPLTGFNSRLPELRINEVRAEYSKPKSEYIELKVLKAGNLSGICVESIGASKNSVYEFPSAEVSEGEYVVLHYRCKPDGASFVDETGADITLSEGADASASGRDFWFHHPKAPLSLPNVFLLRERSGGALMDAFAYTDTEEPVSSPVLLSAVSEAVAAGLWQGEGTCPVFNASGHTATRTLCRFSSAEVSSPASWYICKTSGASPGADNIEEVYSK